MDLKYYISAFKKFTSGIFDLGKPFRPIRQEKLGDHLGIVIFDDYDYQYGFEYFKRFKVDTSGACSVVKKGNIVGRNFDWTNDDLMDVIIQTPRTSNRYATIGVAHTNGIGTFKNLLNGSLSLKGCQYLPFMMCDCLNEEGLYCSINVVPTGDRKNTSPVGSGPEVCQLMLPRLICDLCGSIEEAKSLIELYSVYAPLGKINEECHLFIAQKDTNIGLCVEFADNEVKFETVNFITNFYVSDWTGVIASKVMGDTDQEIAATGLTDHAMGLERYNIISENYADVEDADDMMGLMYLLRYSRAYNKSQTPFWYSEFYSNYKTLGDKTIYSTKEEMKPVLDTLDKPTWITTHTSIYDLKNLTLKVFTQENYLDSYIVEMLKQ